MLVSILPWSIDQQTSQTTMVFAEQTKHFLNLFFVLGHSPCLNINGHYLNLKYRSNRIIATLPASATCIICLSVSMHLLHILNTKGKLVNLGSVDVILSNFNILTEIIRAVLLFSQCYCHKAIMFDIMDIFKNVDTLFANNLKHSISYSAFRKQFTVKLILILGAYFQSNIPSLYQIIQYGTFDPIVVYHKLTSSMVNVAFLHIVFYIDSLRYLLDQLDFVIQRDKTNVVDKRSPIYCCDVRSKLKYYKIIYFRLWEISQQLNQYFGWSLVILFLKAFVHIVFTIYWQVVQCRRSDGFIKLIRMSLNHLFSVFLDDFVLNNFS